MRAGCISRIVILGMLPALAACQQLDPYTRPGMWQPTGANAGNISAMVANPYDLIHGRGVVRTDSVGPALAVQRVQTDQPKALLDPGGGSGGAGGSGGSGSGAGGAGGSGSSGGGSSSPGG